MSTRITPEKLRASTPPGCLQHAIEWTQNVGELKVNGQRLIDLLKYDGVSLWWFGHTLLFLSVKEAITAIEQTEAILNQEKPVCVELHRLGRIERLAAEVCKIRAIPYNRYPTSSKLELNDQIKITAGQFLRRLKRARRKRVRTFEPPLSHPQRILFLSPSVNWRTNWDAGIEKGHTDVFMGRVMEELASRGYALTCVDVDSSLTGGTDLLREKIERSKWRWVPFEHYLNDDVSMWLKSNPNFSVLRKAFSAIRKCEEFTHALEYHNVPLWGFLEGRFKRLLSGLHLLDYAYILEAAREMLEEERPKAVVMTYETGTYARATIVAAQEFGIPTVGIQHGLITLDSVEYMHKRTALAPSEDGCPIPTKTAVIGTSSEQLLTKMGSYPPENVVVTGYTKHDDLTHLTREFPLRMVGLDPSQKTIMVASGAFHLKYGWATEYDKELLEQLLGVNAQLIVRLHPMEDGIMQRQVVGNRAGMIIVKGERNDLLWASDIFVTVNSALALDALVLGKPVFMLDPAGTNIPTIDFGNAVTKYRLHELHKQVEDAIANPQAPTDAEMKQTVASVMHHANTVDGKASIRVAEIVTNLVNGHNP